MQRIFHVQTDLDFTCSLRHLVLPEFAQIEDCCVQVENTIYRGAGASREADLPTGFELKRTIARLLDIRYDSFNDPFSPKSGDRAIAAAIVDYAKIQGKDPNYFLEGAWALGDAMPQAISIDNFIDAHSSNSGVVLFGKLGITQAIIEAERKSKLYFDERPAQISKFDHNKIEDTWYMRFFQLLHENVRKDDVDRLFDNVSFVIFNYDRCIEHYLYHALQNYYGIPEAGAQELMQKITILHPYGVIGRLLWQDSRSYISFGGALRNANLLDLANQIRTFTERLEDGDAMLSAIRLQVHEAETIVFLGFAFHELNMQLLAPKTPAATKRVFATAMGISNEDVQTVSRDVTDTLGRTGNLYVNIKNSLTCNALFCEWWRTLSRGC